MQIRRLLEIDSITTLTRLLHGAYASLGAKGLNYTAVDQSEDKTRQRISGNECMVVEDNGDIIGTILLYPPGSLSGTPCFERSGVAAIGQLAVDLARQGEGIGNRLIQAAERRAIEIGARELALDTAEIAHHLIAWYERQGFVFAEHMRWRGKTYRSVVMVKPMDQENEV